MLPWLKKQVETNPKKVGLYTNSQSWTIQEIANEVDEWAKKVMAFLPEKEKRVAILSQNSSELYFLILALWALHKEIVFLNTHLVADELSFQLSDSEVNTVFVSDSLLDKSLRHCQVISFSEIKNQTQSQNIPTTKFCLDNTASIMYTSGTTGKPKGVIQTFRNHQASSLSTQKNMQITSDDVWACAVPLFHISGLSILIRQLVLGCSIYIFEKFDARQLTNQLQMGNVTVASVVNVMLKQLLADYPKQGYSDQFKCMLVGGGPVSKEMLQECFTKSIPVIQSFGMTETCSQVIALSYQDALNKIGSSGVPLEGIALIIRQGEKDCQPLEVGEILLSGENISTRYLNQLAKSSWTKDGYFKTGDLGYLDKDGYLYVVSRLSELIISGGENIYPAEIEHCIGKIPGVVEVAVVGEEDEYWGEVPVAYLVTENKIDSSFLDKVCQQSLAKYKCPKKYYVIDALPRTASGKVAKKLLLNK
ncbi:o-succinylbenzoate--CoA ligase [Vagococcus bubulae]|uniref:2-succinylbenzoate--CoA ligase n=1 Tax=Vagococcus bubulae TaxID=1977868 RepID=A0A429ZPJ7_9ENTE|nr:o-succinylbenzoate--CoA ligase [Vagococcus bubulae]RST95643.1 o-succinylbenzoate--CoA ligase [Vagococcus bubulae]